MPDKVEDEQPEPTLQEAWNALVQPYWNFIHWLVKRLARGISRVNRLLEHVLYR
jgi:hypothetical protein